VHPAAAWRQFEAVPDPQQVINRFFTGGVSDYTDAN
jgi:hypothetical protein